ncbi:MAG: YfaZ family outer membrane protein [Gammaproteobacteria bacterium]
MKMIRIALFFGLFSVCVAAPAATLDFNLSDSALGLDYSAPLQNGLHSEAGFLHTQDNGDDIHLGLHLVDNADPGQHALTVGVGGRLYAFDTDAENGGSLAVGGFFRYVLPSYNRVGFGGRVYYAPSVSSFGHIDRALEYSADVDYQVLRQASVYVGYRKVRVEFDNVAGHYNVDDGVHLGLRLTF